MQFGDKHVKHSLDSDDTSRWQVLQQTLSSAEIEESSLEQESLFS